MFDFLADLSETHNGDTARCLRLVREAAAIGCRGVILDISRVEETWAPEVLRVAPGLRARRRQELPRHELPAIVARIHEQRLRAVLRVSDLDGVELAADQGDALFVGPHELPWLDLVLRSAESGLPVLLATAMAEAGEVWNAVETALEAGCTDLTVLHGVRRRPMPPEIANLAAIGTVRELLVGEFGPLYPEARLQAGWCDQSGNPGVVSRALNHWAAETVVLHLDLDGQGDGFGAGHCWLPDQAAGVIAGGYLPAQRQSDGTGRIAPESGEMDERGWRADPADGFRPTRAVRGGWMRTQPEATRTGPDVYLVTDGPGAEAITRGLALATTLRDDHDADVVFLVAEKRGGAPVFRRHGFNVVPYDEVTDVPTQVGFMSGLSADENPPLCIVDVDTTGDVLASLARDLRRGGAVVVVVGDHVGVPADLALVPEFGWRNDEERGDILGGSEYLLIGEDTRHWRRIRPAWPEAGDQAPRIAICFDRGDPHGLTRRVAQALDSVRPHAPARAIIGPATVRGDLVAGLLEGRFARVHVVADGSDPARTLAGADLLIASPGQAVAEALLLGVPSLLIAQDPHEMEAMGRCVAGGAAIALGCQAELDNEALAHALGPILDDADSLSRLRFHAQELAAAPVDGLGASRAADRMVALLRGRV